MALRKLRYEDESILRKRSKEVKIVDAKILQLLDDMRETLEDINGLGLAAPQIGVLKRVAIIFHMEDDEELEEITEAELEERHDEIVDGTDEEVEAELIELINPVIIEQTGVQAVEEACLSVLGKKGVVQRPAFVRVRALNRYGEEFEVTGEGLLARALCHEIDHLDGVLFVDKATEITNKKTAQEDD